MSGGFVNCAWCKQEEAKVRVKMGKVKELAPVYLYHNVPLGKQMDRVRYLCPDCNEKWLKDPRSEAYKADGIV